MRLSIEDEIKRVDWLARCKSNAMRQYIWDSASGTMESVVRTSLLTFVNDLAKNHFTFELVDIAMVKGDKIKSHIQFLEYLDEFK